MNSHSVGHREGRLRRKGWAERHMRASFFVLPHPCALIDWLPRDGYARHPRGRSKCTHVLRVWVSYTHVYARVRVFVRRTAGTRPRVSRVYIWQFPMITSEPWISPRYLIPPSPPPPPSPRPDPSRYESEERRNYDFIRSSACDCDSPPRKTIPISRIVIHLPCVVRWWQPPRF